MAKAELWVHYKPSLFQHIGTHSSLKGKVQKLKVILNISIFDNSKKMYNYDRTKYNCHKLRLFRTNNLEK